MRKILKHTTVAVAILLLACFASWGVVWPQVSIFGTFAKSVNGVVGNSGQLKLPQTGSFIAIIPDNIIGRTNSAQGNYYGGGSGSGSGLGGLGTVLDFGVKLDKNLFGWRFRERYINNNFLSAPFQNGKSIVLFYNYAKQYFIYALREIII